MKPIQESGKRKSAIARATLTEGYGRIRVNRVPVQIIEPKIARMKIAEALHLFKNEKMANVNLEVDVRGGGVVAQCDAARIAITKSLNRYFKKKRLSRRIREYDKTLLSGDSRRKESKKWGGPGARARYQKSYR